MAKQNQHEETNSGRLSARVVEEGYIRLQEVMQKYRQARDQGNAAAGLQEGLDPTIPLQNEVQTFFSLIRPYIKGKPQLEEYWWGALATYPDKPHQSVEAALAYYREHSIGVWQHQKHTKAIEAAQAQQQPITGGNHAVADGGEIASFRDWHHRLNLSNDVRILAVQKTSADDSFDGHYYIEGRFAVLGLREIDDWQITTRVERVSGGGFMAGETSTNEKREAEPAAKVETAARMLVEVADELSAIATFQPSGERVHGTPVPET